MMEADGKTLLGPVNEAARLRKDSAASAAPERSGVTYSRTLCLPSLNRHKTTPGGYNLTFLRSRLRWAR